MIRKIFVASLALATIAGASLATTETAEAKNGKNAAFIAGAVGGLVLGGALAHHHYYGHGYHPVHYYEPDCFWAKKKVWNGYKYKFKKVWVCN